MGNWELLQPTLIRQNQCSSRFSPFIAQLMFQPTQGEFEGHFKQAKSHDHEIVRAPKKCPNAVPRHLQNHAVWLRILKYSVREVICDQALNRMLFQYISIHAGPHT